MVTALTTARPSLFRYLKENNPFYLLSAACMLAGCLALTNSLSWVSIPRQRLLILIATLNIYEFLLVGLGLYLIVRRGLARDGTMLLLLEAIFLVDITFLNAEVFTASLKWGAVANFVQFILAGVKVGLIVVVLGLGQRLRSYVFILLQLAVLFAMAGLFRRTANGNSGTLPQETMYLVWWVAGVLAAMLALFARGSEEDSASRRMAGDRARTIQQAYLLLPLASILLHLFADKWIYRVPFYAGNVAPLLLGLGFFCGHCVSRKLSPARLLGTQMILTILAILLSASFPFRLSSLGGIHALPLTPWRLALIAAMLVYLDGLWMHRRIYFAFAAAACMAGFMLGPSLLEVSQHLTRLASSTGSKAADASSRSWDSIMKLIPRTAFGWGVISVVAAFVLLGLGAFVSLRKDDGDQESPDQPPQPAEPASISDHVPAAPMPEPVEVQV